MCIYFFQHVFQRVEHITVPKSDYTYTRGLKNFSAFFVIQTLIFVVMPSAIKLDSKASIVAVKVENISTNLILSTELEAAETTSSQDMPKQFFCVCLFLTKLSGKNEQFRWYRQLCPLTLTLSLRERELCKAIAED
jgi:hypothetical protein